MNEIQKVLSACEACRIRLASITMTCERAIIGKSPATIPDGITVKNNIATLTLNDVAFNSDNPRTIDSMGMMVQTDAVEIAVLIASIKPLYEFTGGPQNPAQGDIFRYENLIGREDVYEVCQRSDNTPPHRLQSQHGQTWIINTRGRG